MSDRCYETFVTFRIISKDSLDGLGIVEIGNGFIEGYWSGVEVDREERNIPYEKAELFFKSVFDLNNFEVQRYIGKPNTK